MSHQENREKERVAIESIRRNIPDYPCLSCANWLDAFGLIVCPVNCVRYKLWFHDYWTGLQKKHLPEEKYKEIIKGQGEEK